MRADDRRDPRCPDRRAFPVRRAGGRRKTDPLPGHGTRARYRRGCTCTPCKAANAAYWLQWHQAKQAGHTALGALVSAVEAQRLIRSMKREQWTAGALAKELGQKRNLARLVHQDMITLRTELKVRRFYRTRVVENPDRRRDRQGTDLHGLEN